MSHRVAAIMQDRSGKASDEETDAVVAKARVVAKRRVSFALGMPIVLLCGGIGLAVGWVFPPQALMTGGDQAGKRTDDDAAQSATSTVTSTARSTVQVVEPPPPTGQSIDSPAPDTTPMTERTALEQSQPAQLPAAVSAPERRGSIEAEAPGSIKHEAEAAGAVRKKKQSRTTERRERRAAREAAKAKRAPTPEPPTQKRSSPTIVSQIPVLGPVFGLLLP
jgi:hypothetical protein